MRTASAFAFAAALVLSVTPSVAQDAPDNPHENPHRQGAADPDIFEPPPDGAQEEKSLPVGTLDVYIADSSSKPIAGTPVTLGVVYNSVAKGESRKRLLSTTNERGIARFEQLETGSSVAYRPMVITDGTFSVTPFRMPEAAGMRALLHVYPIVEDAAAAKVVAQAIVYTEVKDDRIQVQQIYRIFNFGKTAWVPKELVLRLPETFTGFASQQGMTDVGVDAVPKQGARLRGTFAPGQHELEFRWQLPYAGEADVAFDVGLVPNVAAARVIAPASRDMKLEVEGFPSPRSTSDGQGQRALVTERQLSREEPPMKSVSVTIKGLPTEGPGKLIATFLAAGGLGIGLVLGAQRPSKKDRTNERARLLAELTDLERAHLEGQVGPKTYAAARRDLLDALARTFAIEAPPPSARAVKRAKRSA
jgi:hypothetical protein